MKSLFNNKPLIFAITISSLVYAAPTGNQTYSHGSSTREAEKDITGLKAYVITNEANISDVLIVGGGPAGLQAAMSLGRLGRQAIVFDSRVVSFDAASVDDSKTYN